MLTELERKVLDFEQWWWTFPGPKDRAIADCLGMSATRYYTVLRRLLDNPAAEAHDPLTIRRLRRRRRGPATAEQSEAE